MIAFDDAEARRYGTASRRLFLLSTLISLLAPAVLWWSGASTRLWRALTVRLPLWPATILDVTIVLLVLVVALLPASYVSGYTLAWRYGLSRQTPRGWLVDWLKATGFGLALAALALLAFYGSLELAGALWWLPFGLLTGVATLTLTFLLPYVLLPLFFRVQPVQDPALVTRIRTLFDRAHAPLAAVVTLDFSRRTRRANAAVIGLGRSRRVLLTDTLLEKFTDEEIETVVAHELGHHVLGHIPRLVLTQLVIAGLGIALAALAGPWLLAAIGGTTLADRAALPLVLLGAELFSLAVAPLANAVARSLEREADRFAWRLTGRPAAFAAALRRLARLNLVEWMPPRWSVVLLGSHPPLSERVRAARLAEGS